MSGRLLRPWGSVTLHVATAAALLIALRPVVWPTPAALLGGAVAGAALFLVLSAGAPLALPRRSTAVLGALALLIVVAATGEEVVWRLGVLGLAVGPCPSALALAASSLLFAAAHGRGGGRRAFGGHVLGGVAFGGLYLATGSVLPAAAAHGAYNLLVACARPRASAPEPRPARALAGPTRIDSQTVPAAAVASLAGVRKSFGPAIVLDDVSLDFGRGEILCLLGPNGAGKSTLVSLLIGLRRPDRGRVELLGRSPTSPEARRRLGVTPQEHAYPPTLRVAEIAALAAAHYPKPKPAAPLLARFGLEDLADRQAGGLSGGQARKLAVALAFVGNPELVVLDEPTVGLDVQARQAVWRAVAAFAERGGSVLFTTHYLEEAEAVASRIVLLAGGRIAASGSVESIRAGVGLTRLSFPVQPLPPLPTVVRSDDLAGRRTVLARDPEAVLRALVATDADLSGIEVRPVGIEEVVAALTPGWGLG